MSSLAIPGIRLTDLGLTLPADLEFEKWQEIGEMLGRLHRATPWLLGDWINYGETAYGEKYAQAIELTGLGYETLRRYASVAGRFELCRRRHKLSFAAHAEVVSLPPREREAMLDRAERDGLRSRELRELTSGKKSRRERIEEAAHAVWIASRKDGNNYIVPDSVMARLGDVLDSSYDKIDLTTPEGIQASMRGYRVTGKITKLLGEQGKLSRDEVVREVSAFVDPGPASRKVMHLREEIEDTGLLISEGKTLITVESLDELIRYGVVVEDEDGCRLREEP